MDKEYSTDQWQRLIELLAPIHDQARITARRLCRSPVEGDDLFQDAVLRAFRKLPSLRDESCFRQWFYAVLLSLHRTRSRRSFWRRFLPLEVLTSLGQDPVGDDGSRWEKERLQASRVSEALARLPSVQREAVVLFEMEGLSVEEIAVLQNASLSAVKSRLARGRRRLRSHYERLGFAPRQESPPDIELKRETPPRSAGALKMPARPARPLATVPVSAAPAARLGPMSRKVKRHE